MAEAKAPKVAKTVKKAEKPLEEQLAEARQTLLDAKKSLRGGELVNPRAVTAARKEVARMLTKINAGKENA